MDRPSNRLRSYIPPTPMKYICKGKEAKFRGGVSHRTGVPAPPTTRRMHRRRKPMGRRSWREAQAHPPSIGLYIPRRTRPTHSFLSIISPAAQQEKHS